MKELDEYRQRARAAREDLARVEEHRDRRRNLLRRKQGQLARALRQGKAGTEEERALLHEIEALDGAIERETRSARALKNSPARLLEEPALEGQPWELVEGLDDRLPFLLLPIRIETRFMTVEGRKELWVRIFPDDIAVHTHEEHLTGDEVEAGKTYWREIWHAQQVSEAEESETAKQKQVIQKGAWRALAAAYGGPRASWIKDRTRPPNFADATNVEDLEFPEFPEDSIKPESWSKPPHSNVMPDRFVVMGFMQGGDMFREVFRKAGNPIQHPLIVGPDPTKPAEEEYHQKGGELLVGEDIAWIYDFQKAVEVGMGVQIELQTGLAEQGLDRLLVLGLRLSTDEKETQALVEQLFENHSYSPDGLSFVPQGTPTNNTERQGSGFSSIDPGAETSFALEIGDVPSEPANVPLGNRDEQRLKVFTPVKDPLHKRDGQRLVEALGIDYTPPPDVQPPVISLGIGHTSLGRIQYADRSDVRDAQLMNRALWSGTLGYYMEEMLDLKLATIEKIHTFFRDNVTGRGPLPAIRAGTQPYGMLLTSDFSRWKWSLELDGALLPELNNLYRFMGLLKNTMAELLPKVARVGATDDPSEDLLNTLGLQASSVEFDRRHAVGRKYLWNYLALKQPPPRTPEERVRALRERIEMIKRMDNRARFVAIDVGITADELPSIFHLSFFQRPHAILDPLVDDIPAEETETLSETKKLRAIYRVSLLNPERNINTNYIGWLGYSPYSDIKNQLFVNSAGEPQPIPRPLLYRMLRTSLLQALHDAALRLYAGRDPNLLKARREVELSNIQGNLEQTGTVTRWEYLEEDVRKVLPEETRNRVAEFLLSEKGLSRPEAVNLRETLESIRALADLSTAQLERAFAEHIDLCSYRLDAWQTGCFNRRLLQQRFPLVFEPEDNRVYKKPELGLYLGAFGWVEDLRPGAMMPPADLTSIPTSLHDPERDGVLFKQSENAGFIHGPSLNHAVTAAILRSAYLTHFDPSEPKTMAVNLSSERVRVALAFLDGVRNGQDLGALLGYQFERGLADRHNDPSLNQFIPNFRQKYPVMAEKITPGPQGVPIKTKEARNVFDGYALVEAVFLRETKLDYPYGVTGLPAQGTNQAKAIQAEVARMAESLDAIADLSLAEGVYQVAQGNFDRAGAMLKAMTQGDSSPDPEIVRTPRSGAAITHRVALHLPTGTIANPSPRAAVEPGLNIWLRGLLPNLNKISYAVLLAGEPPIEQNLATLGLRPIDLVYLIGDDLNGETTELESRIAFQNRVARQDDNLEVRIDFMAKPENPQSVTLFELLPLLRALGRVVKSSRPLGAKDYQLPSETPGNLAESPNPLEVIRQEVRSLQELESRVKAALEAFESAVNALRAAIPPNGADEQPDPNQANAASLRAALRKLADFGVPDAFPLSAFGGSDVAKSTLTRQAVNIHAVAAGNLDRAKISKAAGDVALASVRESEDSAGQNLSNPEALKAAGEKALASAEESVAHYRSAAQAIFGPAFNLIPTFSLKNQAELQAAKNFRDADPANNLTRHHRDNPLLVEEWLEGAARVQPNLSILETITILAENFGKPGLRQQPIQLPFRLEDHWVAVEYPAAFQPEGEFLSVLQVLPDVGFQPTQTQSGLLIDEWIEAIPSKSEMTGIAFHFNQPNSEPPQACLLAVTPAITGAWTWDKLVGILHDTFDRAKQRAVEPDQLGETAYGHLLPAILAPIASSGVATITTDLVHQTATQFPD